MIGRLNDCCYLCVSCERRACHDEFNDISPGESDRVCADCYHLEDPDAA